MNPDIRLDGLIQARKELRNQIDDLDSRILEFTVRIAKLQYRLSNEHQDAQTAEKEIEKVVAKEESLSRYLQDSNRVNSNSLSPELERVMAKHERLAQTETETHKLLTIDQHELESLRHKRESVGRAFMEISKDIEVILQQDRAHS